MDENNMNESILQEPAPEVNNQNTFEEAAAPIESRSSLSGLFPEINLLAPITTEHDITYYQNEHVFNFNKSEGMAHIIRGTTSIIGHEINLAIFDIAMGIFQIRNSKKEAPGVGILDE
jgi:hypothetical protein